MAGNKAGMKNQGSSYALLCSESMDKVSFPGSKISLISRYLLAPVVVSVKLLRLLKQENSSLWYRVNF